MAKLPHPAIEPGTSSQAFNMGERAPTIGLLPPKTNNIEIEGTHAKDGKKQPSLRDIPTQDPTIAPALEAEIEVNSIDAISRVTLYESTVQTNEIDSRRALASLYGHNLAHGLLSFVIPRLRHPDVLRPDKHGVLLEHLAQTLKAAPEDQMACEGLAILQQDLRWLILLRQNLNSLIEG
ncbi:hypothetical protein FBZ93_11142 [Bradyrhizobium macuxiense]|uniref:Uncharacterized protein n=1 Tax=Bradyrhizobium macuxiense TaxID=1755647 RepID=A0A560LBV1_9BRAD|nr:hypothetical protein [Bradyrhizobium macuxiense]TWB93003.1 hypothetical protein FBZ93_11142 [Bradyrhizobium macuxiense]